MDCGECGCNALDLVEIGMLGSRPWAKFECTNCQRQTVFRGEQAIVRPSGLPKRDEFSGKAVCPECGSDRTEVYSHGKGGQNSRIRYHKCDCGSTFKTPKRR